MHTCIVCGGQTTEGSPICDACRAVSTASPPTTDEKQTRLTAVLRAASMRAELEAEAGDGAPLQLQADGRDDSPAHLDPGARDDSPLRLEADTHDDSPAHLDPGARDGSRVHLEADTRDGSPAELEAEAGDGLPTEFEAGPGVARPSRSGGDADADSDETVILRVVDADTRALEAPPAQRTEQHADVPSRLIAAFIGTGQGDTAGHPGIDIEAPAASAPTSDADAEPPAADDAQRVPQGDGGGGGVEPARAASRSRPADGDDDTVASLARWITAAQAALIGVGLLCLVQLVVLLVLDGYLARAASTADEARAIAAQHKVAGVMLPALVGLALAATALAAWRVLLQRQHNGASTSSWSMPAGLPLALWAVLFMASVLLGVAMPGGQATAMAARRVDQVAMIACALLGGACLTAARQLVAALSPVVDERREARLQR